jgi:hypothetical protein
MQIIIDNMPGYATLVINKKFTADAAWRSSGIIKKSNYKSGLKMKTRIVCLKWD